MLLNINKRLLEEENYVRPTWASISSKKKTNIIKNKYAKPSYMKGLQFNVLYEIPCTDSYIIEVIGKNFSGRKLVNREQILGLTKIVWDGISYENLYITMLKRND